MHTRNIDATHRRLPAAASSEAKRRSPRTRTFSVATLTGAASSAVMPPAVARPAIVRRLTHKRPPAAASPVAAALPALLLVFAAEPALAYLEPGTGSLLMQTLFGLGVAAMMAVRVYWARIKGFFARLRPGAAQQQNAPSEDSDESEHT